MSLTAQDQLTLAEIIAAQNERIATLKARVKELEDDYKGLRQLYVEGEDREKELEGKLTEAIKVMEQQLPPRTTGINEFLAKHKPTN